MGEAISKEGSIRGCCAGKGCNEKPIATYKLKYINKYGDFCISCAAFLIGNDLVEEVWPNHDSR